MAGAMDVNGSQEQVDAGLVSVPLDPLPCLEAQLLLALSRPRLSDAEQRAVHDFLQARAKDLDWGFFIGQACKHAVMPLISRNLVKLRLSQTEEGRSLIPYRWIFAYSYEGNRRRNLSLGDEYAKVLRSLNASGIRYAVRKGPVLIDAVYKDPGIRRMADLDVLISRSDLDRFGDALAGVGYAQGHQSRNGELVVPFERETQLYWRLNVQNALPFIKIAQRDDVEVFVVDPCLSLFQSFSAAAASAEEFLERVVPTEIYGEPSFALEPLDRFLDLCVHLHKEAVGLYYIEAGKAFTVMKFLDVAESLRALAPQALEQFPGRVEQYNCADSVYFALHHTALLYPGSVPPALLNRLRPASLDLLEEYGQLDGKPARWDRPFAERLFAADASTRAMAVSTVPVS
jgi:hypothetical protein